MPARHFLRSWSPVLLGLGLGLVSIRAAEPLRLLASGTPERRAEDEDVRIWLSGRTLADGYAPVAARVPEAGEIATEPRPVEPAEVALLEEITQSILPYPELAAEAELRRREAPAPSSEGEGRVRPEAPRWAAIIATGRDERERSLLALLLVFANRLERRERIPAAAIIAMALHESGYGRSRLAAAHHNYFGLKVGKAAAPFVELPTKELGRMVRANFRAYRDFEAGIEGFAEFLRRYPRYQPAWSAPDSRSFIAALLRAGYCPEPDYLDCIETIFRRHRLDLLG